MSPGWRTALVTTLRERCRVCFACVRECPAKAIRISGRQAEVIPERCIACGNCVRVCSQGAKQAVRSIAQVEALLASGTPVAACLAPSFPAEFPELPVPRLVGAVRALGFAFVQEVAFGADLVARRYRELLAEPGTRYIATTCPAVVSYVERYHPSLVELLAPVASPMVATARVLRRLHGPDLHIVFVGPCIAKKGEDRWPGADPGVDEAITFGELREMWREKGIEPADASPEEFDPPRAGSGAIFPVSRGMLQAAEVPEDLTLGEVVSADGRSAFVDAVKELESGDLDGATRLLELLCCNGCVMGSGMTSTAPLYKRRALVTRAARERLRELDRGRWEGEMSAYADLDLGRSFFARPVTVGAASGEDVAEILRRMGKPSPADELNCGACGYDTCREHAAAVHSGLAESEMCLPFTIDQLRNAVREIAVSHDQLASAQQALLHSERLASMGQLAAGIAHEVNNPLGVVLLYSHLLLEGVPEGSSLRGDLQTVAAEADRCKKIVSGLLDFARQNKVSLSEVTVDDLVAQSIRGVVLPERVDVEVEHEDPGLVVELDRDQIVQVVANLVRNAAEAMPRGGTVIVRTRAVGSSLVLSVTDGGTGISKENLSRVFEPFFTTKPIGKGTGLGLPVSYGIVKMHRGDIDVVSNADPAAGPTGTVLTVRLPLRGTRGA
ncbi:MAG TPA: [Fe-Fe] hydrogenase large subunit C-terminal domain-containing protein [Thermoanaerobaculia bacterium]|nr:[Fe-Fe] hydrogenase large subunit C-terminal domain-containing protein [Thermoanaerobaculia bacterium]HQN06787.1 [Fe-Fe] hydrogenase large subunit C-terminal domain-containing protein [Thermoanaerobaculia bacterium]HQP84963.1 [Fe-Fe] hydrogenase large subunit C-terminal domain-containing protein [Thermoanaerobaculia bacterium]